MSGAPSRTGRLPTLGVLLALTAAVGAWADGRYGWATLAFRAISGLFYEQSALAALREPSQVVLFRVHLLGLVAIVAATLVASRWASRHAALAAGLFALGYAVRAGIWIAGSNLPLVPGDSSHYVEVATSILHGEGPVKHYVESFFTDYPDIAAGRGTLDDWATPLYSYLLAGAYRLTGVVPGDSLEATFAVAKGLSFALNLATLPVMFLFAFRRYGPRVALGSLGVLAILPVHALYAGFELRESLVALTSLLAVWFLAESWAAEGASRWGWAAAAGVCTGLAILSRNTAMALAAASGIFGLVAFRRTRVLPLMLWGVITVLVIAPWALATWWKYGEPFYTYTKYFQYNFSWAVHHYDAGNTRAAQFYTSANAPAIARVKLKTLVLVATYSAMILSLPLVLGFARALRRPSRVAEGRAETRLAASIALAFVVGTLLNIADVTQVAQLGRYYVPVFVLMIPGAVAGLLSWLGERGTSLRDGAVLATIAAGMWAAPSWAFDYHWLSDPYQLHWPPLMEAGRWVREHPERVPPDARILTWFPWEFRLASRRITILMNRSLYPPHVARTMDRYGVTHVLWGSIDQPPSGEPEAAGRALGRTRETLGLSPSRRIYATPDGPPRPEFPVSLYDVRRPR